MSEPKNKVFKIEDDNFSSIEIGYIEYEDGHLSYNHILGATNVFGNYKDDRDLFDISAQLHARLDGIGIIAFKSWCEKNKVKCTLPAGYE